MLSANVIKLLNDQMNLEFYSSNLYLQMSAWCEQNGFEGAAKFLSEHAAEEMQHMRKLFTYLNETGALAVITAIEAPSHEYKSLKEIIELTYEHEKLITSKINELVGKTFEEKRLLCIQFLTMVCCRTTRRREIIQRYFRQIKSSWRRWQRLILNR